MIEQKYINALKAGTIGGLVILFLSQAIPAATLFIVGLWGTNNSNSISFEGALLLAVVIGYIMIAIMYSLEFIILMATGALSAKFNAGIVKNVGEATLIGGFTGFIAEVVGHALLMIAQFLIYLVTTISSLNKVSFSSITGLTCCLPIEILLGVVFCAIGAFAYILIKQKWP